MLLASKQVAACRPRSSRMEALARLLKASSDEIDGWMNERVNEHIKNKESSRLQSSV